MKKRKKSKKTYVKDLPPELRGLSQNRWGGYRLQRLRGFKGTTYGPAGPVKIYTEEEKRELERQMGLSKK